MQRSAFRRIAATPSLRFGRPSRTALCQRHRDTERTESKSTSEGVNSTGKEVVELRAQVELQRALRDANTAAAVADVRIAALSSRVQLLQFLDVLTFTVVIAAISFVALKYEDLRRDAIAQAIEMSKESARNAVGERTVEVAAMARDLAVNELRRKAANALNA